MRHLLIYIGVCFLLFIFMNSCNRQQDSLELVSKPMCEISSVSDTIKLRIDDGIYIMAQRNGDYYFLESDMLAMSNSRTGAFRSARGKTDIERSSEGVFTSCIHTQNILIKIYYKTDYNIIGVSSLGYVQYGEIYHDVPLTMKLDSVMASQIRYIEIE